ncbi:uncharacterized protein BO97DRAFT_472948 [Aspergillus homomorphus CBS 101889]|uniref:DUF7703 domain-containing protein n=1 Tax=Aspergillus homomorphus (strain CBS 101889) TaxID=1450537 RepID=A0A395HQP4_ASPHC|nr:hypothetical protein BO97DRAFT_472948 [Aspergillus homomorphus CBS 101889]RAL08574.1 hypothetical protein BO97DRAFT_472948 [Aspergillus homomorphus CBS 101889]
MSSWHIEDPMDGISGELSSQHGALRSTLLFFMAVSWYNVIELVVLVLTTFRRWRGLYFWSLLLSGCLGVAPYTVGFLLKFFSHVSSTVTVTVLTVGWWVMVTGQSLVLYSRLHLVLRDERLLHRVLALIIANVFLLHIPTTVLTYGANVIRGPAWVRGYNIMEKLQLTGFTLQEVLISMLYIWETVKLLRMCSARENRKIMRQLVGINVAMLIMDLVLLSLEYANYYAIQISLKGAVYSIKLKLEFAVLGRLVAVVHNRHPPAPLDGDLQLSQYTEAPDSHHGSGIVFSSRGLLRLVQIVRLESGSITTVNSGRFNLSLITHSHLQISLSLARIPRSIPNK